MRKNLTLIATAALVCAGCMTAKSTRVVTVPEGPSTSTQTLEITSFLHDIKGGEYTSKDTLGNEITIKVSTMGPNEESIKILTDGIVTLAGAAKASTNAPPAK